MGRNIRLLRSVYFEPFVTKRYIKVGEVEKKAFLALRNYWIIPLKEYRKEDIETRNWPEIGLRRHTEK